jgi:hypothetical protein
VNEREKEGGWEKERKTTRKGIAVSLFTYLLLDVRITDKTATKKTDAVFT